jgi:hypothetical protein
MDRPSAPTTGARVGGPSVARITRGQTVTRRPFSRAMSAGAQPKIMQLELA